MGDVIHALPAVAALREAIPNATIGWVIEERWTELLSTRDALTAPCSPSKPLVDVIHTVNTRAWRKTLLSDGTWKESSTAVNAIRAMNYDIAIDIQGAWKSAFIAQLSGAPVRLGFVRPRERGATLFYTRQVEPRAAHVIEQNLELVSTVTGAAPFPKGGCNQLLPTDSAAERWAEAKLREHNIQPGHFAIINPGAGWGAKCWPAENYGAVARALSDFGLRSVVNFGPAEEELANRVVAASAGVAHPSPSMEIAPAVAIPCSIAELIALTRRARLFIGGDTGPMHLAAALRVPVVGIFGPTNPARNGPFATESIVIRRNESATNHSRHAAPDEAMLSITTNEVLRAARILLDKTALTQETPHD